LQSIINNDDQVLAKAHDAHPAVEPGSRCVRSGVEETCPASGRKLRLHLKNACSPARCGCSIPPRIHLEMHALSLMLYPQKPHIFLPLPFAVTRRRPGYSPL
jgi:hypothetical protein